MPRMTPIDSLRDATAPAIDLMGGRLADGDAEPDAGESGAAYTHDATAMMAESAFGICRGRGKEKTGRVREWW